MMGVNFKVIRAFPYAALKNGGCLNPECKGIANAMPLEALHEDPIHHNSVLVYCPYCGRQYIAVRKGKRSDIEVRDSEGTCVYPEVEEYPLSCNVVKS